MQYVPIAVLIAELIPAALFGLAGDWTPQSIQKQPKPVRIIFPAISVVAYLSVSIAAHLFQWKWLVLYAGLPVAVAWLSEQASAADSEQRGNWRDAVILLVLGLAVDLRWFDSAWPAAWASIGKALLVDIGLYSFSGIRQLTGTGFILYLRGRDWKTGLRELAFLAPLLVSLGLALGFLHPHPNALRPAMILATIVGWFHIFLFGHCPRNFIFEPGFRISWSGGSGATLH